MARIRTIKPDFWTDEQMIECPIEARLLFIGLLNFADDNGNQKFSTKKIKMQIFPADNIDVDLMLESLMTHGVLTEYSVNGVKYLNIKGFKRHQVINRPSKSDIPTPENGNSDEDTHGGLIDGREGKGKEGKGRDKEKEPIGSSSPEPDDQKKKPLSPACPHQDIIDLYHEILPELQQVKVWNDTRQSYLRARWREDPKRQNLDYWRNYFLVVRDCDWLMGRVERHNTRPFFADLEWLVRPTNFAKVIEGKYTEAA